MALPAWEVLQVPGDEESAARQGDGQEWLVVGVGQRLGAGRCGNNLLTELVEGVEEGVDALRREPELGTSEDPSYSSRIAMSRASSSSPASTASMIQPGGPDAGSRPDTRTFVSRTTFIHAGATRTAGSNPVDPSSSG